MISSIKAAAAVMRWRNAFHFAAAAWLLLIFTHTEAANVSVSRFASTFKAQQPCCCPCELVFTSAGAGASAGRPVISFKLNHSYVHGNLRWTHNLLRRRQCLEFWIELIFSWSGPRSSHATSLKHHQSEALNVYVSHFHQTQHAWSMFSPCQIVQQLAEDPQSNCRL